MVPGSQAPFAETASPPPGEAETRIRGLLQVAPDDLVMCEVRLTDESLEFSAQSPGGEFGSVGSYSRNECKLVRTKRTPKGELLLIRHPDGVARLYFPTAQREDAARIRDELTERTGDPVLLAHEFASLVDPEDDEDDNY